MKVYVSTDGDGIGSQVGQAGLADDVEGMRRISDSIKCANQLIVSFVLEHGGKMILEGGDESSFEIDAEKLSMVADLREKWHEASGATLSVGVGKKLSQAGMALMAAKLRGKDQIVLYTPDVEREVIDVMNKPEDEESKIKEAYFKSEDEIPAEEDSEGEGEEEPKSLKDKMDQASDEDDQSEKKEESNEKEDEKDAEESKEEAPGPPKEAQGNDEEIGSSETKDMLRELMGQALVNMKENAPKVEALREKDPQLYGAIRQLVESTAEMVSAVLGDEGGQSEDQSGLPPNPQ